MPTVLILDDQTISLMILEELIHSIDDGIHVECFTDPVKALEWAKHNNHDLVITDYKMPNMDGVEFTHWFRKIPSCTDIPLVIITCVDDKSIRYQALEAGATDFLTKPIDHYECRARCRNLLQLRKQQVIIKDRARWLEQEISRKTEELQLREKETLLRLAKAGEFRDEETGDHVLRMSDYACLIARSLNLDDNLCEVIRLAAPMHDIGKIGIPDHILLKPGKLTSQEWNIMQKHTRIGYDILRDSTSCYIQAGAVIAYGHHERFDGKGYPQGLAGNDIPIEARVVAVADVFDALRSERPYKSGWSLDRTLGYLEAQRGNHFDPDCVDVFMENLGKILAIHDRSPGGRESLSK